MIQNESTKAQASTRLERVLKRGVQNDLKIKQSTEAAKSKVATSEAIQTEVKE